MPNRYFAYGVLFIVAAIGLLGAYLGVSGELTLLSGKGAIAKLESKLIIQASLLMLIVMIAVFTLLFYFAWTYRATNTKATYMPNWEHARMDELIWWAIPLEIVLVLGALTYTSTHALDPRQPIIAATPSIEVQVIALPDSWLFIYPDAGVQSYELHIPVQTPIAFSITADAPMNSFWIPALGGQIYAMTGMVTQLHLIADEVGVFQGRSANYSGEHFSKMTFPVHVTSAHEYEQWLQSAERSAPGLFDQTVGQYTH